MSSGGPRSSGAISWHASISTSNCGGCPVLAGGEAVTHGPCDCFLYDRMAQRPAELENFIFEFLGVLDVESGLKPSKRGRLTSDCFFNFLQGFQAILYHELYSLLRF
jgi:hypothetical protein